MKYFKLLIFLFLSTCFTLKSYSLEENIVNIEDSGNIFFIRHAMAPGNGDPENISLEDCKTQRNLSKEGIIQSKKIGKFFIDNKIKIEKVLSSEWCRCKDTALNAFSKFETLNSLNSFYDDKFSMNKKKQIKNLKNYIKNWDQNKNLVLVTHYVVILEILNVTASSGEIIKSNKKYEIVDRFNVY